MQAKINLINLFLILQQTNYVALTKTQTDLMTIIHHFVRSDVLIYYQDPPITEFSAVWHFQQTQKSMKSAIL